MSGRLAGGGDIYDGYCSQCGALESWARKLEAALAEEKRAQFIGPIQGFEQPTFYDALSRAYDEAYAVLAQKPIWAEWMNK